MREVEDEFKRAGINVRFVVIGTPALAGEFCGRFGVFDRCIADPEKKTYKAVGLGEFNFLGLFTNQALQQRRRENKEAGFKQNWRATRLENAAQLPGAAVIDEHGELCYLHRGEHPGDVPPMRTLLAKAKELLHR